MTHLFLHLSLITGVGPATMLKIIKTKPGFDWTTLYRYHVSDFTNTFGISQKIARLIVTGLADKKKLNQELDLIERYKITVLPFLDDAYPESLKQIYHPPMVIYCKGDLNKEGKRIAIVGSRKADAYAKSCAEKLVPALVDNGWEIVSGGAIGVDSIAHKKTIEFGGKTIVVFGSGLMQPYPASNKELFRTIVRKGGALVSPFSLQTTPAKGNFPARNRIISGLSQGCIIIQAAERSGALITAQFALDQGKQIFALPGKIDNHLSAGCHTLIQQGAKLITNIDDILEEFGLIPVKKETKSRSTKQSPPKIAHPILKHLNAPCSIDELSLKTSIEFSELQNKLFHLQLEGKVKQNFAGLWELQL